MSDPLCECGHLRSQHKRSDGRCTGLDSYGIRCECWSWTRFTGDDDPDDD